MDEDTIAAAVQKGISAAMSEKPAQEFYIDREEHYKHHEFIDAFISLVEDGKQTIFKTLLRTITLGVISLIGLGVLYWYHIKTGG